METLTSLKLSRGTIRAQLTKALPVAHTELAKSDADISLEGLTKLVHKFDSFVTRLQQLDSKVLGAATTQDPPLSNEQLEQEASGAAEITERAEEVSGALHARIDRLKDASRVSATASIVSPDVSRAGSPPASSSSEVAYRSGPKLPYLQIPKFAGDPLKWTEFWELFAATIDSSTNEAPVTKMSYLKSYLTGRALQTVEGIPVSNDNYEVLKKTLRDCFSRPQEILISHFCRLIELPRASHDDLPQTVGEIETQFCCLGALRYTEEHYGDFYIPILLSKLPRKIIEDLARRKGDEDWDITTLMTMLDTEIHAREATRFSALTVNGGDNKATSRPQGQKDKHHKSTHWTAEALVAPGSHKGAPPKAACAFCQGPHYSDECQKFSNVLARKAQLKNGSCFKCLKVGHKLNRCSRDKPCWHCRSKGHHSALCNQKFPPPASTDSSATGGAESLIVSTLGTPPVSDSSLAVPNSGKADIPECCAALMPLVSAAVCQPGGTHMDRAQIVLDPASG